MQRPPHVGSLPIPDKLTRCGLPPPLSLIETVPLKVPLDSGAKVTTTLQDLCGPSLDPQVLVWEKLVPETVMPARFMVLFPTFVMTVVWQIRRGASPSTPMLTIKLMSPAHENTRSNVRWKMKQTQAGTLI